MQTPCYVMVLPGAFLGIRLDFNPQRGHEQAGRRPALVLSPAEYNRTVTLAVVCPITNEKKGYPWEVEIPDNPLVSGVVLADQVKSLDWQQRKAEFVCTLAEELLEEVVEKTVALVSPEEEDV
jgi:mRNA interferase MazF